MKKTASLAQQGRFIEASTMTTPAVLQVDGLCFSYPQRTLFDQLSMRIPAGLTLVRGGDGAGKTTLMRLLAGELPAHAGHLQINHVSLGNTPGAYRQQVFWADPRSSALDDMTATDYFKLQHRLHCGFDAQLLGGLTAGLALAPHLDKPLHRLSTGSKRKVWLAGAFAAGAAVTLLDDPFAALDQASINFVMALLEDAADHPTRAWVLAHYEAPGQLLLAATVDLAD